MEKHPERYIGKMLKILSNLVRRKVENELNQRGIAVTSSQARIIGFLYHQTKLHNIYQRDIEVEFDIRRSTVTNTLQILEKNGYIVRASVEEDARLKKILLTEKGIGIHEILREILLEVEGTLNNAYTAEELNQLFYLLDKLYPVLEE